MNREEQRKLRELKKALPKMLAEKIRPYKFKKRDERVWHVTGDMFLVCTFFVNETVDGGCKCSMDVEAKPLWIDDLLWDCLRMEGNKKEPLSLRATGAFTVSGVEIYQEYDSLKEWTPEELERYVDKYLEEFSRIVQTVTIEDFYNKIKSSVYHEELRVSLTLVHDGKYREALEYLSDKDKGRFCNKGLWIHDGIREYCRKRLGG